MLDGDREKHLWNGPTAFFFALFVCTVQWASCIAGSFGPDFTITIHPLQFSIDTKVIFLLAPSLLIALYCFHTYSDCRSSLLKVNASWKVYLIAVLTGLILPFLSYPGTHYPAFPWGREVAMHLAGVFAKNLFLVPFWEAIIWQGCFLKNVRSFSSASGGILLMSVGWTIWNGGNMAFSYSAGIPLEVLLVALFIAFFAGIISGSVFEMSRGSLWPCVLLNSGWHAAALVYYTEYNRISELGSYVSELIFVALAAALFFRVATRQNRAGSAEVAHSSFLRGS